MDSSNSAAREGVSGEIRGEGEGGEGKQEGTQVWGTGYERIGLHFCRVGTGGGQGEEEEEWAWGLSALEMPSHGISPVELPLSAMPDGGNGPTISSLLGAKMC